MDPFVEVSTYPVGFKAHWAELMIDACKADSLSRLQALFTKAAKSKSLAQAYCSFRSRENLSILQAAISTASFELIRYIVEECGADEFLYGCQALGRLPNTVNAVKILRYLIEQGAILEDPQTGRSILHVYSQRGNLALMKYLIEVIGMDIDQVDSRTGSTASLEVISSTSYRAFIYLALECQCNIYHKNNAGKTFLIQAAFNGHLDVLQYLVETQGFECDAKLLKFVIDSEDLETFQYVLHQSKLDPYSFLKSPESPLHYALENDSLNIVAYLLKEVYGNINIVVCEDGSTAFHVVTRSADYSVIASWLSEQDDIDLSAQDKNGQTVLDLIHLNNTIRHFEYDGRLATSYHQKFNIPTEDP